MHVMVQVLALTVVTNATLDMWVGRLHAWLMERTTCVYAPHLLRRATPMSLICMAKTCKLWIQTHVMVRQPMVHALINATLDTSVVP
jgi:hypothetical protein